MITSEFDGWAIGAYIKALAHPKTWTSGSLPAPGDSEKVLIYGGAVTDANPPDNTNKLDFTYSFYAIGFHHEDMGDTFAAVSYLGYYNPCKVGPCHNSYV